MPTNLNQLWQVASSGIFSQQRRLEAISHNVANSSTVGYRAGQSGFQAAIRDVTLSAEDVAIFETAQEGDIIQEGMGARLSQTTTLFHQGSVEASSGPFHLAISGQGFFQLADENGNITFTRAGDFERDAAGQLVNSQGLFLEPAVTIPEEIVETYVDSTGRIFGHTAEIDAEVVELGQIELATFDNPEGLERAGESAFQAGEASGPARVGVPGEEGRGGLINGHLETSNVDLSREMVDTLRTHRAYSLSLKALNMADEMYRLANEMPRG